MARPLKEGLDYFPHDTDMSADDKVMAMEALHGHTGYAFYCKLLERIYRSPGGFVELKEGWQKKVLASWLRITEEEFTVLLNSSLNVGLFNAELYTSEYKLSSNGVVKRRAEVLREREYMRTWRQRERNPIESPLQPNGKVNNRLTETIQQPNGHLANVLQSEKRGYGEGGLCKLTDAEYAKLIERFGEAGTKKRLDKLASYVGSKGKSYKSHYMTILSWALHDEEKGKKTDDMGNSPSDSKTTVGKYAHMVRR